MSAQLLSIPFRDYLADPAPVASANSGTLNTLLTKSALHAWYGHPKLNPDYRAEEGAEFDYGTAAHALLLDKSEAKLMIVEADDWRKKDAQELRKAAREAGKTALLARQIHRVRDMVRAAETAIAATGIAQTWATGASEQSILWTEGPTHCRARLDRLSADKRTIFDYKTCLNAHPDAALRAVINFGYDVQAAFYQRGIRALTGQNADFIFVFQEKDPPYACSLVALDPAMQDMAERKVDFALQLWANCMATGKWSGYPNRIAYLTPPAWYAAQVEEMGIAELIEEGTQI